MAKNSFVAKVIFNSAKEKPKAFFTSPGICKAAMGLGRSVSFASCLN